MQETLPQADAPIIADFMREITAGWDEIDANVMIEIRSINNQRKVHVARFALDWIDDAIDHALEMNKAKQNVYMCINPVDGDAKIEAGKGAKDTDILAAFYSFADADTDGAMQNILSFAGPKFTMSVKTGTVPFVRGHAYWKLEEPCLNLDAWREVQRSIAASLGTDPAVINPSRIMRIAGTVSWPNADKQAKGYVPELVTMRTEFSTDREAVPFERMMRAFPAAAPKQTDYVQIDTGQQAMDRALAEQKITAGEDWHNNIIRLVASYVSKGLSDTEIHALTDRFTMPGYSVEDTRVEVQQAIEGARAKGWSPTPDPVAERMMAQSPVNQEIKVQDTIKVEIEHNTWPTPIRPFEARELPKREWVYGTTHIRKYLSVTASAGGIGKTSLTLAEAMAVATGRAFLGTIVKEKTKVWVINLEDPRVELELRTAALMKHYNITHEELHGNLFLDGEDDIQITLAAETRDGIIRNDALLEYMTKKIRELDIGLVIIDPLVSAHAVNENANVQVQIVVAMLRQLARDTNAAVHLVHHIRKSNGSDADVDSIRGANSLIGAARAARVINRVSLDDCLRLGLDEDESHGVFRVDDAKANLAEPIFKATYMRTIGVQIDNEEWIGTVTPIVLPDLFEGITVKDTHAVQKAVGQEAETDPLRESVQATRWVGHTVGDILNIDTKDKAGKARVNAIVKRWIDTDILRREMHPDKRQGREVAVIVVGQWINNAEPSL